jgi:hypothetical protein
MSLKICSPKIFKMPVFVLFHLQKSILELIFSVECLFIKLQNCFLNFEVLAWRYYIGSTLLSAVFIVFFGKSHTLLYVTAIATHCCERGYCWIACGYSDCALKMYVNFSVECLFIKLQNCFLNFEVLAWRYYIGCLYLYL